MPKGIKQDIYRLSLTSVNFSTILTVDLSGCTIPGKEVVSGTVGVEILEALKASKIVKIEHFRAESLKLGNSKVKALVGQVHARDMDLLMGEPSGAAIAIHLCNLVGNPAC